jgi:ATP-dependent DNA helicase RecG
MEIEKQCVEYKSVWDKEYLKWVCGYANAFGGTLYIGINNDREIVGIEERKLKKLSEDIPNQIQDTMGVVADVNILTDDVSSKSYFEIKVDSYPYPVNYKGEYHYRSGSTKQELRGAALNKFLLQKAGKHWDGVPVPKVTVNDLSLTALQRFRKEAARSKRVDDAVLNDSMEILIQNLNLFDEDTGCLKRAAILLFHPNPERFFTGAYIKIGFFLKNDADLVFQDEVHGSLMEQIDKAFDLLRTKYITYAISYEGVSRRETPSFPETALRESLLNSVAHKDYSSGVPIQISVYTDHLVFWNSGTLPEQMPLEKLFQKHSSIPFNPDIANAFFRCGDIEAWGRGYKKILDSVLEHKQLPPQMEMMGGLMLTYYANVRTQLLSEKVDENVIKIIEYVAEKGSITNSEIQKLLNVSKVTATRLIWKADKWLEQQGKVGQGTKHVFKWKKDVIGS